MKLVIPLTLGLSLAAPAFALADCPVRADLAQGITIAFVNGGIETFREVRPGVVAVYGQTSAGEAYVMTLGQGFHLIESRDLDGQDTGISYDYGMDAAALPVPQPGGNSTLSVQITDSVSTFEQGQAQSYGKARPVDIGACRYSALEGMIAYETDDNFVESILYFPELGFGFLQWSESDDEPRSPLTVVEIRAGR